MPSRITEFSGPSPKRCRLSPRQFQVVVRRYRPVGRYSAFFCAKAAATALSRAVLSLATPSPTAPKSTFAFSAPAFSSSAVVRSSIDSTPCSSRLSSAAMIGVPPPTPSTHVFGVNVSGTGPSLLLELLDPLRQNLVQRLCCCGPPQRGTERVAAQDLHDLLGRDGRQLGAHAWRSFKSYGRPYWSHSQ